MGAPNLPSFFKQNQHKRFDYAPRYYDERKERIEEIKKKYAEDGSTASYSSSNLKMRLSSEWRNNSRTKSKGTSLRLIIIAGALFLLSYLILFN